MPRLADIARLGHAWSQDVRTDREELEATRSQAFVLAAHAFAWRLSVVTLPVAVAVSGSFLARGDISRLPEV